MLFEDNDFDVNMAFFIPDVDFNRTGNVLSPMDGFLRGNMFQDEYDNKGMLDLFKKYVKEEKELCKEYVNKYGPLEVNEVKGQKFDWINSPWPWETRGGSMYV